MSPAAPKAASTRAIQIFALLAAFGVVFAVNRIALNQDEGVALQARARHDGGE